MIRLNFYINQMCAVTFSPKFWENCYVTVHDYRRRFADPYYFEFGSGTQTSACTSQLLKHYNSLLDVTNMHERPTKQVHVFLFCVPNLVGNFIEDLVSNLEIFQLQGDFLLVSHEFPNLLLKLPYFLFRAVHYHWLTKLAT